MDRSGRNIRINGNTDVDAFAANLTHHVVWQYSLRRILVVTATAGMIAPDFFFQPQVYRSDGENVPLPEGQYTVMYTGGPEYLTEEKNFTVDSKGPGEIEFRLKRRIDPAMSGWYSGDPHIPPWFQVFSIEIPKIL